MNGQMPQMFKGDDQAFYSVRAILSTNRHREVFRTMCA